MTAAPEELPQETRVETTQTVSDQELQVAYREAYIGPLPHPDLLNQFDHDTKSAIINDFVAHSQHQREMERTHLDQSVILTRRTQDRSTLIALAGLLVAAVVAIVGQPFWGAVLALIELTGGVAVALVVRKRSRKDS